MGSYYLFFTLLHWLPEHRHHGQMPLRCGLNDLTVRLSVCRVWAHRYCRRQRVAVWRPRRDGGGYLPGLPSREGVAYVSGPAVGEHACKTLYLGRRRARKREPLRMKMRRRCRPISSVGQAHRRHCAVTVRPISNRAELPMVRCCTGRLRAVG